MPNPSSHDLSGALTNPPKLQVAATAPHRRHEPWWRPAVRGSLYIFFIPLPLDSEPPTPSLASAAPPWTSVSSERYIAPMSLPARRDRLARCCSGFFSAP